MSRPAAKRASSPDVDRQPLLLQCTWSDGQTMFGNVSNGPTPEMMDQTRDENNEAKYMQLIEPHSKKEVDWLKKLGDSLVKEQDPALYKRKGGQIWFSSLPEGYRLYEQVQVRKTSVIPCFLCLKVQTGGIEIDTETMRAGQKGKATNRYLPLWPPRRST